LKGRALLQYCRCAIEGIYVRDTTGKGDGKKETLHEESTAEGDKSWRH
jgi:hypothetical protein